MNEVMGAKHSIEPPVIVLTDCLELDETQDMSGGAASEGSLSPAKSHASGHSLNSNLSSSGTSTKLVNNVLLYE